MLVLNEKVTRKTEYECEGCHIYLKSKAALAYHKKTHEKKSKDQTSNAKCFQGNDSIVEEYHVTSNAFDYRHEECNEIDDNDETKEHLDEKYFF